MSTRPTPLSGYSVRCNPFARVQLVVHYGMRSGVRERCGTYNIWKSVISQRNDSRLANSVKSWIISVLCMFLELGSQLRSEPIFNSGLASD